MITVATVANNFEAEGDEGNDAADGQDEEGHDDVLVGDGLELADAASRDAFLLQFSAKLGCSEREKK